MAGRTKKIIHFLLLTTIGGIFAFAGVKKALNPGEFASDISHYNILPWTACVLLSLFLPWLEIVCATALFSKKYRIAALLLISGMTLVFLVALISTLIRGLNISCGCFGSGDRGHAGLAIIRDSAILMAAGACWWLDDKGNETQSADRIPSSKKQ